MALPSLARPLRAARGVLSYSGSAARTHAVMRRRAAAANQSLQEYLLSRLIEEASTPTFSEVLDRAGGRSGGSVPLTDAVAAVRDDRARR